MQSPAERHWCGRQRPCPCRADAPLPPRCCRCIATSSACARRSSAPSTRTGTRIGTHWRTSWLPSRRHCRGGGPCCRRTQTRAQPTHTGTARLQIQMRMRPQPRAGRRDARTRCMRASQRPPTTPPPHQQQATVTATTTTTTTATRCRCRPPARTPTAPRAAHSDRSIRSACWQRCRHTSLNWRCCISDKSTSHIDSCSARSQNTDTDRSAAQHCAPHLAPQSQRAHAFPCLDAAPATMRNDSH